MAEERKTLSSVKELDEKIKEQQQQQQKKVKFAKEGTLYNYPLDTPEKIIKMQHIREIMKNRSQKSRDPEIEERIRQEANTKIISELENQRRRAMITLSKNELQTYKDYNNSVPKLLDKKSLYSGTVKNYTDKLLANKNDINRLIDENSDIEYDLVLLEEKISNIDEKVNYIDEQLKLKDVNKKIGKVILYDASIENIKSQIAYENLNAEETKKFEEEEIKLDIELQKQYEEQEKNILEENKRRVQLKQDELKNERERLEKLKKEYLEISDDLLNDVFEELQVSNVFRPPPPPSPPKKEPEQQETEEEKEKRKKLEEKNRETAKRKGYIVMSDTETDWKKKNKQFSNSSSSMLMIANMYK